MDHDPATFVVGFSARASRVKDTRRNLEETRECVINVVSENLIEPINATSLDVAFEMSEWPLSGLTPLPSSTVMPERVKEAAFAIEGKLLEIKSLDYHGKGEKESGALAIIGGTRFWVRGDAINEGRDEIDLEKFRPIVQLGGMSYGRITEVFELPRPALASELADDGNGLRKILEEEEQASVENAAEHIAVGVS